MVRYSELSFEEKSKIIPRYDDPRFDEFMNNYFEIMSDARDVTPFLEPVNQASARVESK
jgi:hypothetical protein